MIIYKLFQFSWFGAGVLFSFCLDAKRKRTKKKKVKSCTSGATPDALTTEGQELASLKQPALLSPSAHPPLYTPTVRLIFCTDLLRSLFFSFLLLNYITSLLLYCLTTQDSLTTHLLKNICFSRCCFSNSFTSAISTSCPNSCWRLVTPLSTKPQGWM